MIEKKTIIQARDSNTELIEFLSSKFKYLKKEEWINFILKNNVQINSKPTNQYYILKENDLLSLEIEFEEPEIDTKINIIFEDEFIFAVDKNPNLPVHPAGRYQKNNLSTLLGDNGKYIINRIDRETSGIVFFAKDSLSASKFGKLFSNKEIQKRYISYVHGNFPKYLKAEGYLSKDNTSLIRKKKKFTWDKISESSYVDTEFYLLETKRSISKIYAIPKTGKIHQIRATLFSLGFPIIADKIYGLDEKNFINFIEDGIQFKEFGINRQALHAEKIEFIHPFKFQKIEIFSEEPKDMQNIFLT